MSGPLVVQNGWMMGYQYIGRLEPNDDDTGALYKRARELGAATVYVKGDLRPAIEPGCTPTCAIEVTGDQAGEPWRWRLTREGGPAVTVVSLDRDTTRAAGPWEGLSSQELAGAFAAFERLCGVPWGDSVGHTAEALILAQHPRDKGGVLLDAEPFTPAELAGSGVEGPWAAWRRDPTKDELAARWVHSYDANAQYLGAWGTVELGHGRPTHTKVAKFDHRVVGFWRIPSIGHVRNLNPLLPAPWLDGREWFSTPTVRRLLEVCDGLEAPDIAEAWTWPRKSRFLLGAANKLRDARAAAMNVAAMWRPQYEQSVESLERQLARSVTADAVLDAVKAMYRVQTGRFGMAGRSEVSGWARPDWGHLVRAQARVNMHRRLAKLGQAPFAIATDGVMFASDEPDPVVFAQRIRLPLGPRLGEYRHTGSAAAGNVWAVTAGAGRRGGVAAMFAAIGAST